MSSERPPPAERASTIISSVPSSPNLITKTGTVVLGSGLMAAAISQELYVVNEETVVLAGFAILITYIGKVLRGHFFVMTLSTHVPFCSFSVSHTRAGPRGTSIAFAVS